MAIKKADVEKKKAKAATLMSKQDTKNKGDAAGSERVMLTFWVSPEKKQQLKEYAQAHGVTQTHVLVNGLDWALKQD